MTLNAEGDIWQLLQGEQDNLPGMGGASQITQRFLKGQACPISQVGLSGQRQRRGEGKTGHICRLQ